MAISPMGRALSPVVWDEVLAFDHFLFFLPRKYRGRKKKRKEKKRKRKLTAVDILGSLLGHGAGAVLRLGLGGDAGLGAVGVEVALVVHGLLERVALPAEDVVAVGGGATVFPP
jgi:hypothetical protein